MVHPRELTQALAAYDRLLPDTAQDMLATWRQNPAYLLQRAETLEAER